MDNHWSIKDIVYTSIVGAVMLAAFLEWFLWLAAFLYCLFKVYQKAETLSTKLLVFIHVIIFTLLRLIFLPIMVVTLPLPHQVSQYFPHIVVSVLQWFAFYTFAGLLTIPWVFCVYQLVTKSVGRRRRIKQVLDENSAPKVVIVMPCYNEQPEILLRTVDSIVDCEYPPTCLHIFLSFDGDQANKLYLNTIEKLGIPISKESYPKSIDVPYRDIRITVSRFPHGGKRSCQKKTFKLIDQIYDDYIIENDNLFVLFIDSDCILDRLCIQNFMYEMELKPGSSHNMLAMTGVITSTTEKNSLITIIQDQEYVHGQLFERTVESGCGAVTCLPGALTILRFTAFRKMAKYYFADNTEQCEDLFDFAKCHLGEDRWLTHLFMIGAPDRYQIQMNTGAFCKTEAVQNFRSLLKQRRRWFLGFITNEVCMLTDIRLWRRYPVLCLMRLMQNTIRTTALLFFIMCMSILTTTAKISDLPVGFIAVSLGLNWALMAYFAVTLGRYKVLMYPIMFVCNPFLNWIYMVYGIFTAGQRTWGGPRADAAKANAETTPAEAIALAKAAGDDLNIIPESFRPALEARSDQAVGPVSLFPPSMGIAGRFSAASGETIGEAEQGLTSYLYDERRPGARDSGLQRSRTHPRDRVSSANLHDSFGAGEAGGIELAPRANEASWRGGRGTRRIPLHPRPSFDSFRSGSRDSVASEVFVPRRVESFLPREEQAAFRERQKSLATERPPGGAGLLAQNAQAARGMKIQRTRTVLGLGRGVGRRGTGDAVAVAGDGEGEQGKGEAERLAGDADGEENETRRNEEERK